MRLPEPHPLDLELHRLLPSGFYVTPDAMGFGGHQVVFERIRLVDLCVREALSQVLRHDAIDHKEHVFNCVRCAELVHRYANEYFRRFASPEVRRLRYHAGKPSQQ